VELKADKVVVLAAVTNDGIALQDASMQLKADKEVVLVAVTQIRCVLQCASADLKADKEVVLAAVAHDGCALGLSTLCCSLIDRADFEASSCAIFSWHTTHWYLPSRCEPPFERAAACTSVPPFALVSRQHW
jgi:hypothetical protein